MNLPSLLKMPGLGAGRATKEKATVEKASSPAAAEGYHDRAIRWDQDQIDNALTSARRAWMVASVATAIAALSVWGMVTVAKQKTTTAYVMRINEQTGVPDAITVLDDQSVAGSEIQDKYWLAKYVRAREGYDWFTLQADYEAVGFMSTKTSVADYLALYTGDEPLQEVYGSKVQVRVEVLSIVLRDFDGPEGIATVRFTESLEGLRSGVPPKVSNWVATIGYTYDTSLRIKESVRMNVNPLGFQVQSYRVDPEVIGDQS